MYYRVENEDMGNIVLLKPKECFEATDDNGNVDYEKDDEDGHVTINTSYFPELCFSKEILGAFFGKRQYLKEDHEYFIYATEENPDTDLSHNDIFDFATIQEVRYKRNIEAKLIGSVGVSGFFIHNMERIEESICYDFSSYHYDNEKGRELLKEMEGFLNHIDWL